ncbi:MAG: hypothetical protein ACRECP_09335 [Methylocella sp.]
MNSSLVPKLALCVLLVLALSFKVSVGMRQFVSGQDEMVRAYMATFLARHGFQPNRDIANQNPLGASGRSGGCELLIAEVAYQGWQRDFFRRVASEEDQFFFFFRGRKYQNQPVWLTRLSGYWTTFLRNLGFNPPVEPVLGIVASPPCDLNAIPWQELADHVAALRQ